ncbi:MAG: serine hydrolase domain-containing protein [Cyanobacteriota bacterium]|nr:serine hydrolase domain-containing protein [Cyanobacteriota bacterium]
MGNIALSGYTEKANNTSGGLRSNMNPIANDLELHLEPTIAPWIAKKENINLAIGIIQGEQRWVKGWGSLQSQRDETSESIEVDGKTIFEIGSVTKVFTTTLLSLLVECGKLELTTPINRLGKAYQSLPNAITLESLATHTSGLPPLPSNLNKSMGQDEQNPYAAYTFEELHDYLRTLPSRDMKNAGTISYSNLGVGLLGNILAEQLNQSYEATIVGQICNPLGLLDTRIALNDEQQTRFAAGYLEDGKPIKPWDLPTLAGAGALRSTADDLLAFVAANLQPEKTAIATAILNTHPLRHNTFAPTSGVIGLMEKAAQFVRRARGNPLVRREEVGVALGWFVEYLLGCDRYAYTHTGGTGGHRSFCGFIKETQTGVIILSNYGEVLSSLFGRYSIDRVGLKLLEIISDRAR